MPNESKLTERKEREKSLATICMEVVTTHLKIMSGHTSISEELFIDV